MGLELEIVDPLGTPSWDELLMKSGGDYSFFHSSSWARVLHSSYGYKPFYFAFIAGGKPVALIPCMEVKGVFGGKRGVSLPFSDYCDPIVLEKAHFREVFESLLHHGRKNGWRYVEIKGGGSLSTASSCFYGHTLDLAQGEESIASRLRDSTRRNIEKASREGVEVSVSDTSGSVRDFYRLHLTTRKRHGLPPQPYKFFREIYEHVISRGLGFVVLASYDGRNIAGAVFFHFGEKAFYKFGAADMEYQRLRASNLVMWEAIRRYSLRGYKSFCFGRTEPGNTGLKQFKAGWGAEEQVIRYYKYDLNRNEFAVGSLHPGWFPSVLFKRMPSSLLQLVGSLFYKQMG